MEEIKITTEYIKLSQMLKFADIINRGCDAKPIIEEGKIKVNNEIETKRGKKLKKGDIVEYNNKKYIIL